MKGGTGVWLQTERIDVDGFGYRVRIAGQGPALVLLHGFTGSGDTWSPFVPDLARHWRVIAPDLPGHGGSDIPADVPGADESAGPLLDESGRSRERRRFSLASCAADLSAILDRLEIEAAAVVGYSLGGRTALTWAALHPERVRTLVLESASPGLDSAEERRLRREQDEVLAKFIEEEGVAAFVERWENLPLFAGQRRLPEAEQEAIRRRRLANSAQGLAASLRCMGTGVMAPLHGRLASLTMPVLLLAGSLDDKFRRFAERMGARFPNATVRIVEGAGHAVHAERPEEWLERVGEFLHIIRTESGDLFGHSLEVGG